MVESAPSPPPFDISKATKLKEVEFGYVWSSIQWITMTLQTSKFENLRRVTIGINPFAQFTNPVGETTRREWEDLDHVLDRMWTLHSIYSEVTYEELDGKDSLREVALSLLPKLASKGAVKRGAWP